MRQMLPNMMNQISEGRVRQGAEGLVYRPTFAQENVLQDKKIFFLWISETICKIHTPR